MAPIRVGIIGYGNSARTFHLPYITRCPDLEVVAFLQRAEPTQGKAHCSVDYPKACWHKSIEAFCADKDIDLGIVITGHISHAELATKVLESGKHGTS
jgi:predicted dehydrogenase